MVCPRSYHISCIPPSARFHELALLCHEHAETCKLPDLNVEDSFQGEIERQADDKFDSFANRKTREMEKLRKSGKNPFFVGATGDQTTRSAERTLKYLRREYGEDTHDRLWFCLPLDIKQDVHSKPAHYRHTPVLRYDPNHKPPKVCPQTDICSCVGACGEDCINRLLYIECYGDYSKNPRDTNCRLGPNCGNRQCGQRQSAKCKPMREQGKGWGLVCLDTVKEGDLVQEYVGEVIDAKEKEERLIRWTKEHPNDPNFYVMALQAGWFIDARHVANLARFINHSCDPNCRLTPVNVNGRIRCGIFALRDIPAGQFLSYDYHFDTQDGDKFVCRCGAKNCRGTMKGGVNQTDLVKKKKKKRVKGVTWEEARARYERDKRFLQNLEEDTRRRRSQVSAAVPGAENLETELVANGPQAKYKADAQSNRIFLWRNVVLGADFARRVEKRTKESRRQGKRQRKGR